MKPKRLLALGVLLLSIAAIAPITKAQKSAPPQPTELQKLKERVDALESQLKEAQAKADRAAMEKDYIDRIQKEVNAYYEKAFNTQLATVTIIALIVGLVGKFGVDHIVQSKLTEASATLREEFAKKLDDKFAQQEKSHADRLKQLEDDLNQLIKKELAKLENKTMATVLYSLAASLVTSKKYTEAIDLIRQGLETIAVSPEGLETEFSEALVSSLFYAIQAADHIGFTAQAQKELAAHSDLYKKFQKELNAAATEIPELAQVLKETREAPPSTPKS